MNKFNKVGWEGKWEGGWFLINTGATHILWTLDCQYAAITNSHCKEVQDQHCRWRKI